MTGRPSAPDLWAQRVAPPLWRSPEGLEAFPSAKLVQNAPPKNWQPIKGAVRDQGGCSSCTSFAVATMYEVHAASRNQRIELAAAWMHENYAYSKCDQNFDLPMLVKELSRKDWLIPYVSASGVPPVLNEKNAFKGRALKSLDTPDAVYASLRDVGPVAVTMRAGVDFFEPWNGKGAVYRPTGETKKDHAICLIGYDNDQKCWLAKNSYGEDWGDRGYGRIGYGTCEIGLLSAFGIA